MNNSNNRNFGRSNNYRNNQYGNQYNNQYNNQSNNQQSSQYISHQLSSTGRGDGFMENGQEAEGYGENIINAESLNIDTTLKDISKELRPGETLILDIGNNYFHQTDEIYDTLVMRGYEVRKSFKNGRNQIIVSKKA